MEVSAVWVFFWQGLFFVTILSFFGLVFYVTAHSFRDIVAMFRDLRSLPSGERDRDRLSPPQG